MCEKEEREITQFQMQRETEHIILHILLGPELQDWYDLEDTEIKRLTTSWIAGIDLLTRAYMLVAWGGAGSVSAKVSEHRAMTMACKRFHAMFYCS